MPLTRNSSEFTGMEKIIFHAVCRTGDEEIIRIMYGLYDLAFKAQVNDLHKLNTIMSSCVARVEVVLILDEAERSNQKKEVTDRELYNIAVDEAADKIRDFMKSDKQYEGYSKLRAELTASLSRLRNKII